MKQLIFNMNGGILGRTLTKYTIMNWKEQPHLFANGKFKVRFDQDHAQYNLEGEIELLNAEILFELERIGTDCTLIARPISDMSDEETKPLAWSVKEIKNSLNDPDLGDIPSGDLLHLLSIGVYPFDNTDNVIWRYENR